MEYGDRIDSIVNRMLYGAMIPELALDTIELALKEDCIEERFFCEEEIVKLDVFCPLCRGGARKGYIMHGYDRERCPACNPKPILDKGA